MTGFSHDLRFAVRMLAKWPTLTGAAVLSLALGLGANTAIFSAVNATVLRPLPFPDGERLVSIHSTLVSKGLPSSPTSLPDFEVMRETNRTLQAVAAYDVQDRALAGTEFPERARALVATSDLFAALATPPAAGRAFTRDDETWGAQPIVLLSAELARRRFGSDAFALGKSVVLDGTSHVVVGVLPDRFLFPKEGADVWLPLSFAPDSDQRSRGNHSFRVVGRLKPAISLEAARADLAGIFARIADQFPENSGFGVRVEPLRETWFGDVRNGLFALLGAVCLVLLIACANLANLLLARATARRKEIAVRAALGASRSMILRQLLTESVVLSLLGGALGLLLAYWGVDALIAIGPESLRRTGASIDGTVLAFNLALSIATGLFFGMLPALRASRMVLTDSLNSAQGGAPRERMRSALVVLEVALSLVLLVGSGLLLRSLGALNQVELGFNPESMLTVGISLPERKYAKPEQSRAFMERLLLRLGQHPGVVSVGASSNIPMDAGGWAKLCSVEAHPPARLEETSVVHYRVVGGDYFRAMGMTLMRGRLFDGSESAAAPKVILNEMAVRLLFRPSEDPIGQTIWMGPPESLMPDSILSQIPGRHFPRLTVVGIVKDVRSNGPAAPAPPEALEALSQSRDNIGSAFLTIRTAQPPASLRAVVQKAVSEIDPQQPLADVKTMEERLGDVLARPRFNALLVAVFSALALLLAMVGIYGVTAYSVAQRTHELGVRIALGAAEGDVLRHVFRQGGELVVLGVLIGLAGSAAVAVLWRSLLFGVSAADPLTYAAVVALVTLVSGAALYGPARRAVRVDPMVSLRSQ